MSESSEDQKFHSLTGPFEDEREAVAEMEVQMAFTPEPRPIPDGLIPRGLPLGHIALVGDFDPEPRGSERDNSST